MQDTVDAVEDMLEEISNEKILLMTGTIKPFADVSYKDPKTRYMEYQKISKDILKKATLI